ncbi:purine-nucleoside phosphorylase [Propylenella binzhouense]|uniref:Purine nucleoside phosphorylase n=1 Tax=Propylenella binzhouense TaxID=2555902 RepID=A0A964T5B1_9HYPH|nr:purine-nucleoside phosphorylase [Propylenella binzhouense]MYZ48690.1 purine-nucleoside phosphorylase [Propylenella binzhouense]
MSALTNAALVESRTRHRPKVAVVLGSGLGGVVDALRDAVEIPYCDLAGFPEPAVSGHDGRMVVGTLSDVPVMVLAGRAHYYESGRADGMRMALETVKAAGAEVLVLTNAAGSLDPEVAPGSLMLVTDHINMTGVNPLIGEASDARFVGMTAAYDAELAGRARNAARSLGIALARGVYMWFSGPSFETPAEIRAARALGADAVGMSTVPEVILARFLGLRVLAFSVITNFAAGMGPVAPSHEETKARAPEGGAKLKAVLARLLEDWNDGR